MLMEAMSTGFGTILLIKMLLIDILTERPTVPRPNITTVDPLEISATFQAAPKPNIESQLLIILNLNEELHFQSHVIGVIDK